MCPMPTAAAAQPPRAPATGLGRVTAALAALAALSCALTALLGAPAALPRVLLPCLGSYRFIRWIFVLNETRTNQAAYVLMF